jgi:PIN domain
VRGSRHLRFREPCALFGSLYWFFFFAFARLAWAIRLGSPQCTSTVPQARKLIAQTDPDDVDVLALVLHLGLPLWSNDNDFEGTGIAWYTTAELLSKLGFSPHSGQFLSGQFCNRYSLVGQFGVPLK